jgi:phosphatidylglycerol:prolipoprotein diacylglycerol transferase
MLYPNIDPVLVAIGPAKVHWYGLMYLVAFGLAYWLASIRARTANSGWKAEEVGDLIFYGALGVVIGGRMGSVFFYHFGDFLQNPFMLFRIWEGGMSFHGGLLGVLVAMWWYGRKTARGFFTVTDFIAPMVPTGLGAGRIGNFINGELWGKETSLPWGMQLPCNRFPEYCPADELFSAPRHPSQLYEFALEGVVLFVLLWWFSSSPRPVRAVSGMFLLAYGGLRFAVEFVRLPDAHLGYLALDWITMGQVLSLPMILFGLLLLNIGYSKSAR